MKRSAKLIQNTDWDKSQEKGSNFKYCDVMKATVLQLPIQGFKYLHSYNHITLIKGYLFR